MPKVKLSSEWKHHKGKKHKHSDDGEDGNTTSKSSSSDDRLASEEEALCVERPGKGPSESKLKMATWGIEARVSKHMAADIKGISGWMENFHISMPQY